MTALNSNVEIRKVLRDKRRSLSDAQKKAVAKSCFSHFLTIPHLSTYQNMAFYQAFDGEMDPTLLINHCWQQHKKCYLPVISKDKPLHFFPYFPDSKLIKNQYHILEPNHSNKSLEASIIDLDLICLPLVAFDKVGYRLGMGKGYYDKTLYDYCQQRKNKKPFLLGLAYSFQKVDKIMTHEKDVKLDGVLTEKEVILF